MARRTRPGGYHLAWSVPEIESAVSTLEGDGYHSMNVFTSTLWDNARCVFLVSPEEELLEFVEGSGS